MTPPATPQNLKVELKDDKDVLTWDAVQDTDSVRYQILRDDRVIASTSGTKFEIDHTDNARYFVRAADSSDNYSASTPGSGSSGSPDSYPHGDRDRNAYR